MATASVPSDRGPPSLSAAEQTADPDEKSLVMAAEEGFSPRHTAERAREPTQEMSTSETPVCSLQVQPLAFFLKSTDPDVHFYNELYHYLSTGNFPDNISVDYRRSIKKRAGLFFLNKTGPGLCYNLRNPKMVVTDRDRQQELIREVHVDQAGLHHGVRKMYQKIFSKYYWRSIYIDISNYVKSCEKCSELPVGDGLFGAEGIATDGEGAGLQRLTRRKVWIKVQLKVYGPFNRSLQGNEHLVVLLDSYSGFAVAQALPPHSLESNCASFLLHSFCRLGFAHCQAVGVSDTVLGNMQSYYKSLRESCAATLRTLAGTASQQQPEQQPGSLSHATHDQDPHWAALEEVVEAVVSRDGLSWDVEVQHQLFRHNTRPQPGDAPSPFAIMFARDPTGIACDENDERGVGDPSPPPPNRRRLRSATLQCRHCDDTFTSKISFRIHQRKHTEDARRRGALDGEVPYVLQRKTLLPKKKRFTVICDRELAPYRVTASVKQEDIGQQLQLQPEHLTLQHSVPLCLQQQQRHHLQQLQHEQQEMQHHLQQQQQQQEHQHNINVHLQLQNSHGLHHQQHMSPLHHQQLQQQIQHQHHIQHQVQQQQQHQQHSLTVPLQQVVSVSNSSTINMIAPNNDSNHHNSSISMLATSSGNLNLGSCGLNNGSGMCHTTGGGMSLLTSEGDGTTIEVINDPGDQRDGRVITIESSGTVLTEDGCGDSSSISSVDGSISEEGVSKHLQDRLTANTVAAVKNLLVATKDERGLRGKYTRYSPETRDEIARFAIHNSIKQACLEWSARLGSPLSESTVRNFIRMYKRFTVRDQEDVGKFAAQHGLDKAAHHYTHKLGFSVKKGQIRKFKKLYMARIANMEALNEPEETKKANASCSAVKRSYSNQMKLEIGHYASQFGVPPAVQHFTEKLQFPVKESTVRKFRKQFVQNENQENGTIVVADASNVSGSVVIQQQGAVDGGDLHNVDGQSGPHPGISTSTINVSAPNNFVYQHPYSVNMQSGGQPTLTTGVIPMAPNTLQFPHSGSIVNQNMTSVPYPHLVSTSSPVIMNQSFNQQPGSNGSFVQSYGGGGFSQQLSGASGVGNNGQVASLAMTHTVPSTLTHTVPSPLPMTGPQSHLSQVAAVNGGLLQQQILQNTHQQQQQSHQTIQQDHQHHQQQQHQETLQQPQLLTTCYHSITPGQIFENVSMTNEPLCLLKDNQQGNSMGEHSGPSLMSGSNVTAVNISSGSTPVTATIALGPLSQAAMVTDHTPGPSGGATGHSDHRDGTNVLSLEYDDEASPTASPSSHRSSKRSARHVKRGSICKRGNYVSYSPEVRAAIGKYAANHGNLAAVNYFKENHNIEIPESTVRGLKDKYVLKKMSGEKEVTCLGFAQRGRPMRLGKYDGFVKECIQQLVKSGEKVSSFLVIATAKQVLMQHEPSLLEENGGPVKLNPTWAKSFLRRMGLQHM